MSPVSYFVNDYFMSCKSQITGLKKEADCMSTKSYSSLSCLQVDRSFTVPKLQRNPMSAPHYCKIIHFIILASIGFSKHSTCLSFVVEFIPFCLDLESVAALQNCFIYVTNLLKQLIVLSSIYTVTKYLLNILLNNIFLIKCKIII